MNFIFELTLSRNECSHTYFCSLLVKIHTGNAIKVKVFVRMNRGKLAIMVSFKDNCE